jgi:hypothetical protein
VGKHWPSINAIVLIVCTETSKKNYNATVEDASDEEDYVGSPSKKKKKKKAKKKKKPASVESLVEPMTSATIATVEISSAMSPKQASLAPSQPTSPQPSVATGPSFMSSTTSLPINQTTAQSGRSYLQSLDTKSEKKVKTRPDHASIFSNPETEKKGLFSLHKARDEDKTEEITTKEAKKSWFSKLGKKTVDLMHQLLKTSKEKSGNMKWDDFVKVREILLPAFIAIHCSNNS